MARTLIAWVGQSSAVVRGVLAKELGDFGCVSECGDSSFLKLLRGHLLQHRGVNTLLLEDLQITGDVLGGYASFFQKNVKCATFGAYCWFAVRSCLKKKHANGQDTEHNPSPHVLDTKLFSKRFVVDLGVNASFILQRSGV